MSWYTPIAPEVLRAFRQLSDEDDARQRTGQLQTVRRELIVHRGIRCVEGRRRRLDTLG